MRLSPGGWIDAGRAGDTGFFHDGTRFLSLFSLSLAGHDPRLLDAAVDDDNLTFTADLANPEIALDDATIPPDTIHIRRTITLDDSLLVERLVLTNYGRAPVELPVAYSIATDFADIFEARGVRRERRGALHAPRVDGAGLRLVYSGLDGVSRQTLVSSSRMVALDAYGLSFNVRLAPGASESLDVTVACAIGDDLGQPASFADMFARRRDSLAEGRGERARILTSNPQLNAWIDRSRSDIEMLTIETGHGPYPAAGAPWYVTTFGRDGIICALQMLTVDSRLAAGVLRFLAAHQATETDPATGATPGKIVHEMRAGEMAALGEHRFGRYYGTVDATPLFLMLAGAYYRRTADLELIRSIWPNIQAALGWLDEHGDLDSDGFIEYMPDSAGGLTHQGWKDSHDSVMHADSSDAAAPIALSEVQGYVYAGKLAAAELSEALGEPDQAATLREQAAQLKSAFNRAFWDEQLNSFVLALDGDHEPCRVVTSNAGHCLYAGIAEDAHATRQAATFDTPEMSSGWGLRTLSAAASRYNPLSYHNGSVWPHDNALIAAGLARYGLKDATAAIFDDTFAAATRTDGMRLPELYCGFQREPGHNPVRYPISCTPQAWAAGSVFMLLNALLGLEIDAAAGSVNLIRPRLPSGVDWLTIDGLRVGSETANITVRADGKRIVAELDGGPLTLTVAE